MAEELGRELESLVRLELGLLGLKRRSALRIISEQSLMFHLKRLEGGREPVLDFLDSGSLSCSTTWIKEE